MSPWHLRFPGSGGIALLPGVQAENRNIQPSTTYLERLPASPPPSHIRMNAAIALYGHVRNFFIGEHAVTALMLQFTAGCYSDDHGFDMRVRRWEYFAIEGSVSRVEPGQTNHGSRTLTKPGKSRRAFHPATRPGRMSFYSPVIRAGIVAR